MVHGCMVYTDLAPRRQQFHVAPAMPALKYTTSVDIQKTCYKQLVTHVELHASAVSLLKRAENSAMKAIINLSITTCTMSCHGYSQTVMPPSIAVTWCFTPSQPVWLYQGEVAVERLIKSYSFKLAPFLSQ